MKSGAVLRHLSLDVVAGAVASGAMAARILSQPMPAIWWVALPLSVWVMYTLDHLLDAYRLGEDAHTARHLFHHRYFKWIALFWSLAFISCISWIAYLLPKPILFFGLSMGLLVLVHLGLVWLVGNLIAWWLQKEIGVALIYAIGVWGGPAVLNGPALPEAFYLAASQFFLLALINLLLISQYEQEIDEWDQHSSWVRAIGEKGTYSMMALLGVGILILGGLYFQAAGHFGVQIVYGFMLGGLSWIALDKARFQSGERYRIWADLMFLIPLGFVMWPL